MEGSGYAYAEKSMEGPGLSGCGVPRLGASQAESGLLRCAPNERR